MIPKYLLIQRLEFPSKRNLVNAPFQWGAGYQNGGFDEKVYRKLMKIFAFGMMGAAEYEWGDVPRAFATLYDFGKEKKLAHGEVETDYGMIYYICHVDDEKEVVKVLKKLAAGELLVRKKNQYWTRDATRLHGALLDKTHLPHDVAGGVSLLGSPFLYTVDAAMFTKLKRLFPKP